MNNFFIKTLLFFITLITLLSCESKNRTNLISKTKNELIDTNNYTSLKVSFNDYMVEETIKQLSNPDYSTPAFKMDSSFIKRITKICDEEGVNFSGHYTIVEFNCGANCSNISIVDRTNGKIYNPKNEFQNKFGYAYSKNSALLILNASWLTDEYTYNSDLPYDIPSCAVWDGSILNHEK